MSDANAVEHDNEGETTAEGMSSSIKNEAKSVQDLPMLVMEYILAHFSYHEVLQFRLISHYWNDTILAYLEKSDEVFLHNISNYNVQWVAVKEQIEDYTQVTENVASTSKKAKNLPKISPRYHHSACYVNDSMYIFGGCMSPSTAYNDLWRFDMDTKKWHRIIASGSVPLPRLFSSFTYYECTDHVSGKVKQFIILFGGFLFDEKLDVRERLLATIHCYDVKENRWTLIPVEGIQLKSADHSAVIIGDELVVFNGLRMVDQQEVECNKVYVFDLKKHVWNLQKTSTGSHTPFIRTTFESYRNQTCIRRKMVQTPFALDSHNILYICGCNTNVLFIAAFLLKRSHCNDPTCQQCRDKPTDSDLSNVWEWIQVREFSKIGLDFEITYGGEFCKVGNYLAYLTVKDVTIQKKITSSNSPSPGLPRPQFSGSREHISHANKRLLRERRMEALDFHQRNIENRMRNGNEGPSLSPRGSVIHKSTLQLRLLDISRVVTEQRIHKIQQLHDSIDYTVSPDALSCYSLVASPQSLILFGGFVVDQLKEEGQSVSNGLYMIVSKPVVKLY